MKLPKGSTWLATPVSRWVLGIFFTVAGICHFIWPTYYLPIMPPWLPWHLPLIYLSGVAESAGGIGVFIPRFRRLAGWWLIATLIAIYPANIQLAMDGLVLKGKSVPQWILNFRLLLQFGMIWWVWVSCIYKPDSNGASHSSEGG